MNNIEEFESAYNTYMERDVGTPVEKFKYPVLGVTYKYQHANDMLAFWNAARAGLVAQLEAAQKELGDLLNQEFQQRLANAEHQLYMKDLAIHNIKASRKAQFRKRLAAETALSAANDKLSKPVVLPRMHVGFDGVSTNAGDSVRNKAISDCAEAIRTAGFTADEGKDLWLM